MPIITITLSNKNFQLYCNDGEEKELLALTNKLNEKILEVKKVNPAASSELLLVMVALGMQAELHSLSEKIRDIDSGAVSQNNEQFAETLTTIAGYLENLAQKMGK